MAQPRHSGMFLHLPRNARRPALILPDQQRLTQQEFRPRSPQSSPVNTSPKGISKIVRALHSQRRPSFASVPRSSLIGVRSDLPTTWLQHVSHNCERANSAHWFCRSDYILSERQAELTQTVERLVQDTARTRSQSSKSWMLPDHQKKASVCKRRKASV